MKPVYPPAEDVTSLSAGKQRRSGNSRLIIKDGKIVKEQQNMSDDYGLLHPVAEQDSPPTEIADAFYDSYKNLPDALRAKLSLYDLRCIYETMVHPVIWVVTDKLT